MYQLRCLQSGGEHPVLFGIQCCVSGFTVYMEILL